MGLGRHLDHERRVPDRHPHARRHGVRPIFYRGDLAGFAASRAHWLDIGAKDPGVPMDSVEIFQEGVRLPSTQVVRGGEPVEDIWTIIEANVRFPRSAIGDMQAQFAVASIGEHHLGALFDR